MTRERVGLLKEAIACYLDQTYPRRELVIVAAGSAWSRRAVADHLEALGRDDLRLVEIDDPEATLGAMRNASLEAARGEVVCQWDDDDLYHPQRLELQLAAMQAAGAGACFLTDHLQFDAPAREMYWVDWASFREHGPGHELLPGSMMARRDACPRYPETGEDARWGEDNAFRKRLLETVEVAPLAGHGCLYLYRFHGRNVWGRDHHRRLSARAAGARFLRRHEPVLRRALSAYRLPLPYAVKTGIGELAMVVRA